jgi:transposase InsO family protein
MAKSPTIRLPRQWSRHVKSGVLHAIALASAAMVAAHGNAAHRRRLPVELEQARQEIALLREELEIKDGRWIRSRTRRRPHYTPIQRLRILQLRAARGWTLEKTARVFLLDLHTLQLWIRRVDEHGERELVQTSRPVNRYPDFVRHVVRQLKRLFPAMGSQRIAQILARLGLLLSASTVRRIIREPHEPPRRDAEARAKRPRRAVGRRPGDVWHVDLTAVPTRAGFWVPWWPMSLPQRWPFCWWVAVIIDQVSRTFVGYAVFRSLPTSETMQTVLDRGIRSQGLAPRCVVTDKGSQFKCASYRRWCKRRRIRARFGYLGEPSSIAIAERFIRSMKQECFRWLVVPMTEGAVMRELRAFSTWYNEHRPHSKLQGSAPAEVVCGRRSPRRGFDPRALRRAGRSRRSRGSPAPRLQLDVRYVDGRKHLPVIALRRAA